MNNAIFHLEANWIRKQKPTGRLHRFTSVGNAVLLVLTALAIINLITFPNVPFVRANEASFIIIPILILQTLLNLILVIQTLSRSMSLVGRERASSQNWEAFILTGVDARTVLVAKWRVVIQSMWRSYLALGMIRAVIFPVGVMLQYLHSTYGYQQTLPYTVANILPELPTFIFIVFSTLLITLLQLPLFAALGVLAASQRSNSRLSLGRGISTWLVIVVGTASFITILSFFYVLNLFASLQTNGLRGLEPIEPYYTGLHTLLLSTLTFADSALLSPYAVTYFAFYPVYFYGHIVGSFLLSVAAMMFWTWAALRLSIWLSRRQGMTQVKS